MHQASDTRIKALAFSPLLDIMRIILIIIVFVELPLQNPGEYRRRGYLSIGKRATPVQERESSIPDFFSAFLPVTAKQENQEYREKAKKAEHRLSVTAGSSFPGSF
jgi:hypothetical protein